MADMGLDDQALAAVFVFGTVAIAAVASATLYSLSGPRPLFRDGLRLALVAYLTASFLWALIGFIATFIKPSAVAGCQVAVALAAVFDELARVLVAEYLYWAMDCNLKASTANVVSQVIFVLRFILGAIYVAVQRPQYKPICVGATLVVPVAIVVIAMDFVIFFMLLFRSFSVGIFRDLRDKNPRLARSRGLLLVMLAFGLWVVLSIPMILGIATLDLVLRTVLPAVGSLITIVLIAALKRSLQGLEPQPSQMPQMIQNSTRDFPSSNGGVSDRSLPSLPGRDDSTSRTSTSQNPTSRTSTSPASTSRASTSQSSNPRISVPPSSNPFLTTQFGTEAPSNAERPPASRDGVSNLPIISQPVPGQADAGVGGLPITGQLFPPMRAEDLTKPSTTVANTPGERSLKKPVTKGGKLKISGPIINESAEPTKVATIDLATAREREKERRDNTAAQSTALNSITSPKALSPNELVQRSQSVKRKDLSSTAASALLASPKQPQRPSQEPASSAEQAVTTSAELSPGLEDLRRRSPRRLSQPSIKSPLSAPIPQSPDSPARSAAESPVVKTALESPASPRYSMGTIDTPSGGPIPNRRSSSLAWPIRLQSQLSLFANPRSPPKPPKNRASMDTVDILVRPVPPLGSNKSPMLPNKGPSTPGATGISRAFDPETIAVALEKVKVSEKSDFEQLAEKPQQQETEESPPKTSVRGSRQGTAEQEQPEQLEQEKPEDLVQEIRLSSAKEEPKSEAQKTPTILPQPELTGAAVMPAPTQATRKEDTAEVREQTDLSSDEPSKVPEPTIRPKTAGPPERKIDPMASGQVRTIATITHERSISADAVNKPRAAGTSQTYKSTRAGKNKIIPTSDFNRSTLVNLLPNSSVRPDIRPSRQRPPSIEPEPPKAAKAPVQLRAMNGIPSNPKMRMTRLDPKDQANSNLAATNPAGRSPAAGSPAGRSPAARSPAARSPVAPSQPITASEDTKMPLRVSEEENADASGMRGIMDLALQNIANKPPRTRAQAQESVVNRPRPVPRRSTLGRSSSGKASTQARRDSINGESVETETPDSELRSPITSGINANVKARQVSDDERPTNVDSKSETLGSQTFVQESSERAVQKEADAASSVLNVNTVTIPTDEKKPITPQPPSMAQTGGLSDGGNRHSSPTMPAADRGPAMLQVSNSTASGQSLRPESSLSRNGRRYIDSALVDDDDGKETVMVMLDQSAEHHIGPTQSRAAGSVPKDGSWHHRLGEKPPTFSDRTQTTRARPGSRPPPLPLQNRFKPKVIPADNPRLESPNEALGKIQEQLSKLGSTEQTRADVTNRANQPQMLDNQGDPGMDRLADLEMEMGMQENRWQEMRRDYARDSLSTLASSPNTNSPSAALGNTSTGVPGANATDMDLTSLLMDSEERASGGDFSQSKDLKSPDSGSETLPIALALESLSAARPVPQKGQLADETMGSSKAIKKVEDAPRLDSKPSSGGNGGGAPQALARPRTMRPPRRSRRMSALPDIVEDPLPLLDKRGTLGLFQFPSGEKSDSATVKLSNQRPPSMSAAAPPSFPTLEAQLRARNSRDYPLSFIDQYDDVLDREYQGLASDEDLSTEDDGDKDGRDGTESDSGRDEGKDSDSSDSDSDDSFDEATLWEIASLLKSDKVPSRDSLFPEDSQGFRNGSPSVNAFQRDNALPSGSRQAGFTAQPFGGPARGESPTRNPMRFSGGRNSYSGPTQNANHSSGDAANTEEYVLHLSEDSEPLLEKSQQPAVVPNTLRRGTPTEGEGVMAMTQSVTHLRQTEPTVSVLDLGDAVPSPELMEGQEASGELISVRLAAPLLWSQPKPAQDTRAGETLRQASTDSVKENDVISLYANRGTGLWMPPMGAKTQAQGQQTAPQPRALVDEKEAKSTDPATADRRGTAKARLRSPERLMSKALWSTQPRSSFSQDWISLSTMRPGTPEAASSESSSEPPSSDASSAFSASTGQSAGDSLRTKGTASPPRRQDRDAGQEEQPPARQASRYSGSEWGAAPLEFPPMDRSVSRGASPTRHGGFDASVLHPVFMGPTPFEVAGDNVHPAASREPDFLDNFI
ncbi:hypothetical protein HIM_06011 [Hirsutella minnesotensis 3608]|uniref:Uncharacterized protein n=1 Tax=Hirsutella minnesotensis 3608 TaxID=1043627 RepID=A0A0F7ZJT4_9HYPO|nr:hypothetical protein HIM_06011 [Hirsutella minnesotensis 3608]